MDTLQIAANPFALMMDPAAVIAAVERSDRLAMLKSRICRPLDKPLIGKVQDDGASELDDGDAGGDEIAAD
ncbi:MAG: hypothetical protein JSR59_13335 [Proteobacteria bacterium]|nr:hypothetical protein [Pseudomonadota bacterium]